MTQPVTLNKADRLWEKTFSSPNLTNHPRQPSWETESFTCAEVLIFNTHDENRPRRPQSAPLIRTAKKIACHFREKIKDPATPPPTPETSPSG
jgi:hypothetical protein